MLHHRQTRRFCQPLSPVKLLLRLKARVRPGTVCLVHWDDRGEKTAEMRVCAKMPHYVYYQAELELSQPWRCRYYFSVRDEGRPPVFVYGPDGEGKPFDYVWSADEIFTVPDWIPDAVFYQIFPDRFCNGDPANDPPGARPWDAPPDKEGFWGGDLAGIQSRIPYLNNLGVNALWLNPIFAASSNHRYNTKDYMTIDPALGDLQTFRRLVGELHRNGIRIILDGVFNHTGTDFFAFKDVLEHGGDSPYRDWYHFYGFPVRCGPGANYKCWWDIPALPKLKTENPEVREYLLGVGTYWLREADTDGWRLDVPNEIEPSFWREFRQRVTGVKPDAYIVGEIWRDARFWLLRRLFDGVMNYLFRDLILDCFARRRISLAKLDCLLGVIRLRYPEAANFALLNLLGSHDTARIITAFQEGLAGLPGHSGSYREAVEHLRPALILQFAYPGAPMIYYGDEIGLTGGPDPGCRGTMPWDPSRWDRELLRLYRRLVFLRRSLRPLRRGYFQPLTADDQNAIYAFARRLGEEQALIVLNAGDREQTVELDLSSLFLPGDTVWRDELNDKRFQVEGTILRLSVAANYGAVLSLEAAERYPGSPDC